VQPELRLLIVEDAIEEVELAVWRLKAGGIVCVHRRVENEADFRDALYNWHPDLVLSDFTLPQFDGMSALAISAAEAPDVPFIFLSGTIGEERAIEALRRGAMDYVLKSNPARLVPAVVRAMEEVESRRARRVAEERVARLTRVLQMLSGINTAVVRIRDRDELLREACRLAHRVGGYSRVYIALVDPGTRKARPVAWAGPECDVLADTAFALADSASAETSVISRVIRTGETFACSSIDSASLPGNDRESLVERGVRSFACLPLNIDATPVGAFFFGAATQFVVGDDELRLLAEVAANLSFALQYLEKQDAVRFLSYFDALTGLAKRPLFCERLGRLVAGAASATDHPTVAVFDVEHLSAINDAFGRHVGDLLMQCVADRVKQRFDGNDNLAYLGGGTFACVTRSGSDKAQEELQERIAATFQNALLVEGREIPVTVKIGVACYPENGGDAGSLVQNAEAALRAAKASGERALRHRPEMNAALAERLAMEHRLRGALERNEFVLFYQPKVTIATGRVASVEALLRWRDPERGLIAPGLFLPTLESTGLIVPVGEWALAQAAADSHRWSSQGFPPVRVAVNAAPMQLSRRDFASKVIDSCAGLDADKGWGLDVEITESALLGDSSWSVRTLRVLRSAGVRIAIDDFGTGYSSLSRLSQLPVDTLKIDRSFTNRLPGDAGSRTLVSTIIGLAHAFNMSTVAEGVETREQLAYLERAGCHESQGYLHSRPIPAAELELLLTQQAGVLHPSSPELGMSAAPSRERSGG
jgi:diguanylate cyclase (GGDEF)-like protein